MALLPAKALDLRDGHTFDANFGQRLFNFLQLEGLDNRFDKFHAVKDLR
jgi:hypothetical protein